MTDELIGFLPSRPEAGALYLGSYDPVLVGASFLIATFASYAALEISGRLRVGTAVHGGWLVVGALTMGGGIWAMHFIGMLAFSLPCGVHYDPVRTLASIVPGVLASAVALLIISRNELRWGEILGGGVLFGGGIGAMHYAGMAAMRMGAQLRYDPALFAVSIVVAVVLAAVALSIRFQLRAAHGGERRGAALVSAAIMGAAIGGMHYTAMAAAYFVRAADVPPLDGGGLDPAFLATVVIVVSGLLIAIVLLSAVAMRHLDIARQLREANDELRQAASVFDNTAEGILIADANAIVLSVNRAFTRVTGYSAIDMLGRTPHMLSADAHEPTFYQVIRDKLASSDHWEGEVWNRRSNGELYPALLTVNAIRDAHGAVIKYVALFRDITVIKRTQADLERMAHYDALTGLPNRSLLAERLQHALDRVRRNAKELAVLMLDLDGFKTVNDSLGHPAGDRLLQVVAERLKKALRAEDTVARLGGDEFAVILEELKQGQDAAEVARKLLNSLAESIDVGGHLAQVTASIGIALFPQDGADAIALLMAADTAMYQSKQAGRNGFQFHHADMALAVRKRLELEHGLRRAIEHDEFEVWYQPQIDLSSGRVIGAEALLRWRDPKKGLISPLDFIPLAEETGLIIPIGQWVLNAACADAQRWRERFGWDGKMSVNVAGRQIERGDFHFDVLRALGEHGLPAAALELEITETFIMHNAENAHNVVGQLRELGITTAIDDFGTGYSSLAYLKHLPIDRLKIDRAFVMDLPGDRDDAAIVGAIVALGTSLGFTIIAEGVETDAQRDFLIRAGCDQGQGYLFSKPLPADVFEAWLTERLAAPALSA